MPSRREFLATSSLAVAAPLTLARAVDPKLHVATQVYPWTTFFNRAKKPPFEKNLAENIAAVAKTGVDGFEPIGESPKQVEKLAAELKKHDLKMRSLYMNVTLHDSFSIGQESRNVLAVAREAKKHGCEIFVCNPTPIRWGGPEAKTDAQLRMQADIMNRLGRRLQTLGLQFAYHTHDIEMRHAAREFHHMMLATDPKLVHLCLDAHWIFRGAGDSEVALFDIIKLHGSRIIELHLRQSRQGIWTEAFGPGDIDYPRLAVVLQEMEKKPLVVLEQSIEAKTPNTMDAVAAHTEGVKYIRQAFRKLA